ncbi:MAG: SDR family oxidoreductase [Chloroflexi bacterium]|nr:MAG: SDR family oxidoreductase [Chloroflexota bacterium]
MELGLSGKRVLVTAASKGLGRAVAEALASEACRVCISSSNRARIDAAARALSDAGAEVHAFAADLASAGDCAALFDWTVQTLGGLDILVNNTVGPAPGGVLDTADEAWQQTFDSVLMSAIRLSRAAIPVMRRGGGGAIVNLASLSAKQPIDGIALSNAFRPALIGMAKTLSREAAPDVRVNNIATEHILTDRIRDIADRVWRRDGETLDQTIDRMAAQVSLRRYGTAAELASAVVFLCSDAASYITGVTLAVDGGMDRGLY